MSNWRLAKVQTTLAMANSAVHHREQPIVLHGI
jgi:hypothetical protein